MQCGVSVRALCAVRAVRCFGSRGACSAVFRDGRGPRTARGACGAVFRDTQNYVCNLMRESHTLLLLDLGINVKLHYLPV